MRLSAARPSIPLLGCILLVGATLAGIWIGTTGKQLRDEVRTVGRHEARVAELRGVIAYLNERMVMSTRMAAASGNALWADRFDEAAPKLDAAIEEATELASLPSRKALEGTVGEAHRDLLTMEKRALALATSGDLAAARALLDGPEFAYLEDVHASGLDAFGQELSASSKDLAEHATDRAWLEAAGLALAAVAVISAGLLVRGRARLKQADRRVASAARTDALTSLPNRRCFLDEAAAVLMRPADKAHVVLLIDLDRFRFVNDAHGHLAGDEVLKLAASRLRGILRDGDLLARLDGDEFALMLGPDRATASPRETGAVAARIVESLAGPFVLGEGTRVQIGASVGIAGAGEADLTLSELMHRATVALSRAKVEGRGCYRTFEPGMDAAIRARALLESDLRQAISEDAIEPYYQPLVDLDTGAPVGVEMLARWPHPVRGMVPPDTFIPVAEELGLIAGLTERLLVRACREIAAWPPDITLACNLSPLQLGDPGLPQAIRTALAETGFPPSRLELEVTESALVGDLDLPRDSLAQLKMLGVRLALDDFGTGYSSLRHLQTLPFDKIKIDRSFVSAMADDAESRKIVSAVVRLGHSLGLVTVAEGIETEETASLLRALGCDIGQGWLYGRPVPAEKLLIELREGIAHRASKVAAA